MTNKEVAGRKEDKWRIAMHSVNSEQINKGVVQNTFNGVFFVVDKFHLSQWQEFQCES